MIPKKKLQVFVSSTFIDLKEERQAAVEAILNAGHIPAGMELFAAGDQSQMEVIRHWIDESDVYLLILGGRYGSIESESGKSYIHLEYEYAIEKGMPHFALVINEKYLDEKVVKEGRVVLEQDNNKEFKAFKQLVTAQKVVRFWSDLRDIKYFILESLNEFEKRENLTGWIKGDQAVDSGEIAEQIARLSKENSELREKLAFQTKDGTKFNGLTFEEFRILLEKEIINIDLYLYEDNAEFRNQLSTIIKGDIMSGDITYITLFDGIWLFKWNILKDNPPDGEASNLYSGIFSLMYRYGLVEWSQKPMYMYGGYTLTEIGKQFIFKMMAEDMNTSGAVSND